MGKVGKGFSVLHGVRSDNIIESGHKSSGNGGERPQRQNRWAMSDHWSPEPYRTRSRSATPRNLRNGPNNDQDRSRTTYEEWGQPTASQRQEEADISYYDPDPEEALPSTEHDDVRLRSSERHERSSASRMSNSQLDTTTASRHNRNSRVDLATTASTPANSAAVDLDDGIWDSDEDNSAEQIRDRAGESQTSTLEDDPSHPLYKIRKAARQSNLPLYENTKTRKRATGLQVVYEGEDQKTKLADAARVTVGEIWEIHESAPTGDPDAYLGDGKTAPTPGGLHSSKTSRVVVTGVEGEFRTGFRITSCNGKLQEKIDNMGKDIRYLLIHLEGRPTPRNSAGLPLLRITSWVSWYELSAMDIGHSVSFRPSMNDLRIGNAHITDVEEGVLRRTERDVMGVSTLARTFEETQPYGPFPRQNTRTRSRSTVANSASPAAPHAQSQATASASNPPSGPRSMAGGFDRLAALNSAIDWSPEPEQREARPAARPTQQPLTNPLPPPPPTPTQAQTDRATSDGINARTPAQHHTETDQPGTIVTNAKRKRDDSEEGALKNGRRQSI